MITSKSKIADSLLADLTKRSESSSYIAITSDVEVNVWTEFVDSQLNQIGSLFIWAYHIRIDNKNSDDLRLLTRHWKIVDENGNIQEVDGEGVVGEKPLIKSKKSFQYSSGVHLRYPSGIMSGYYQMQKNDGTLLKVIIPSFSLDAPFYKTSIN